MFSVAKRRPRSLAIALAIVAALIAGTLVSAAPASAAYAPTVKLSKYMIHRGQWDSASVQHFLPTHAGVVVTFQGGQRIVLKQFRTGPRGGAVFGFRIPFKLRVGKHTLIFRTGWKHASVLIRVLR